MARTFALEIVTPDRLVLKKTVDSVTAASVSGEFTALPLHVPFLAALSVGNLSYRENGRLAYVFVSGGFAEVGPDKVLIMAEAAELPEEIDLDRARKASERAKARLEAQRAEKVDYVRAKAALQRAMARMKLLDVAATGGQSRSASRV
ncbi:F0F1 ATP synthase subunit epsilon [Desulfovibrio aerotolerans]|uniref:ATP synthase epsilon chain n=1 Tax=Solidesulfovibrio aerotolerans TaxID=295255 RepID=A0A7C9N4G0_9BACT|nr:F0F1 ATP synthase subunit epsilon [Solidesulfovibrio aerotolerans]MYL82395.1 F0F1 ATP synthase subunit epsilon [Solidesulfovibrio aerotolerans]